MGGLRKLMPKTWWAMLIGSLALVGIPPLSGFFSKDAILACSLADGTYGEDPVRLRDVGAFLTGVYSFRMLFIAFGGEPSAYVQEHPPHAEHGLREWSMAIPVGVLAVLAIFGGWIQFAEKWTTITDWLDRSRSRSSRRRGRRRRSRRSSRSVSALSASASPGGSTRRARWRAALAPCSSTSSTSTSCTMGLLQAGRRARAPPRLGVEGPVIGGSLAGLTGRVRGARERRRRLQTGLVRTYASRSRPALAVLVLVFIAVR